MQMTIRFRMRLYIVKIYQELRLKIYANGIGHMKSIGLRLYQPDKRLVTSANDKLKMKMKEGCYCKIYS